MATGFNNGSLNTDNVITSTYGGTGNGFTKFSGPSSSEKTFTLPNSSQTIFTTGQNNQNSSQNGFCAYLTSTVSNATGDGTNCSIGLSVGTLGLTNYDQSGGYWHGSYDYVTPVTGRYKFGMAVTLTGLISTNFITVGVYSPDVSFQFTRAFPYGGSSTSSFGVETPIMQIANGNRVWTTVVVTGGTKTVSILGDDTGTNGMATNFYGVLLPS